MCRMCRTHRGREEKEGSGETARMEGRDGEGLHKYKGK